MEEDRQERQKETQKSSIVIEIPSYKDVLENNQPKSTAPSLFTPSQTFSQAFSSIKKSEFYSPPPSNSHSLSSSNASSSSRQIEGSTTPIQKSNAILVSHSLRYHLLHPDYLYYRIRELQKNFRLRVVLCHVDVDDVVKPLLEVTKTCLLHDCTLLCGWSVEECGRYLETVKVYENKPADIIQGHMDSDYLSRLNHALTGVRHVNKTDVVTLGSTFGSLSHIMDASMEDLARCPGIGERKVKRLYDTFHEPFKRVVPSRPVAPEAPLQNDPCHGSLESEVPAAEKETEDTSKRQKKDPEVILKSALSVAFAKYSDKLGKKKSQSEKEIGESSDIRKELEADSQI
ncbi:DNA excision repair protein ERCC-1 isoform X2 [Beta vulgaris subsp. vulgaris]|uniref:DNA excision repair protein ERCC-1 isoform X2 n=1 Tax=Beta vulgaris subsp. vulgaris TaxID=3555 RepID=UPI002037259C|nr:DNA excision repair protein ERCC-1 isoform X2 [Beta vulgaris subsp. vulgaris]